MIVINTRVYILCTVHMYIYAKDLTESGVPRSGGKQRDVTLLRVRGSGEDRRTEVRRRQTGIKCSTPEGIQDKGMHIYN